MCGLCTRDTAGAGLSQAYIHHVYMPGSDAWLSHDGTVILHQLLNQQLVPHESCAQGRLLVCHRPPDSQKCKGALGVGPRPSALGWLHTAHALIFIIIFTPIFTPIFIPVCTACCFVLPPAPLPLLLLVLPAAVVLSLRATPLLVLAVAVLLLLAVAVLLLAVLPWPFVLAATAHCRQPAGVYA